MNKRDIGKRIREYQEKAQISQENLGDLVGITSTSVSKIERGVTAPTFENLIKIANALGVSANALLIDVVNEAYKERATELSEKLRSLTPEKRRWILNVVETMVKDFK